MWAAAQAAEPVAVLDPDWPASLRSAALDALRDHPPAPGELALFTSGSSGRPRGVVRSVASWDASVAALSEVTRIGPDDIVWLPGSPTSTLTLYGGWHALAVGVEIRGAGDWPRTPPPAEPTALHATPRVLAAVLDAAEAGSLPGLRVAVVAGASLPPRLRARAEALGWRLVEYYGAAELSFVAFADGGAPDSSAYQRFPGVEVEVRDGRIWARSPYLCRGYLDPDDDGPLRWDGDWATVDDLGTFGPGGLTVLGRGDAAVTTGGRTVVVEEVELAVRRAAGGRVADVAASSIPHPLLGELLVAVVVPEPAANLSRADLDALAAGLPEWSRPRRWWLVEALPQTASGKVDRAAVRAGIADGSLTSRPLR